MMDNLFNYAPKELSNSAIWAWILSALKTPETTGARSLIARNMMESLSIPVPRPGDIAELRTEYSLLPMTKPGMEVTKCPGRMDIYMRFRCNLPSVLYVENKVVETEIGELYDQVKGYYDNLRDIAAVNSDFCQNVYPAYFGYEDYIAEALLSKAQQCSPEFGRELRVFPITAMLGVFEGVPYESDPVLKQFYEWLAVKKDFVSIRRKARLGDHADLSELVTAANEQGFGHLLQSLVDTLTASDTWRKRFNRVRVDTRNVNFMKGSATPVTAFWFYESGPNGLYIGIHKKYLDEVAAKLPADFAFEKRSLWRFGFMQTPGQIRAAFQE